MTKNEYIVQCPRCGAEFPEREKFCPHCDTPNRKMICRSCGAQINASERVCKVCGAKKQEKNRLFEEFYSDRSHRIGRSRHLVLSEAV